MFRIVQQNCLGKANSQKVVSLLKPTVQSSGCGNVRNFYNRHLVKDHLEGFRPAVMNDLPVPQGSWQELNNKRQSLYNKILIGGVTFLGVTLTYFYQTQKIDFGLAPGHIDVGHILTNDEIRALIKAEKEASGAVLASQATEDPAGAAEPANATGTAADESEMIEESAASKTLADGE